MTDPPVCACHGEAMQFRRDKRYRRGGFFYCAVKNRERCRAYYDAHADKVCTKRRERYDADPVHRIGKLLTDGARKCRQAIDRRKEELRTPSKDT